MKKAQVTIFIIIAILIVAGIIAYFSISRISTGKSSPEFNEINEMIKDCSNQVGGDTLYFIAQNGGYFNSPRQITNDGITYYYKGQNLVPPIQKVEQEISKEFDTLIKYCVNFDNLTTTEITDYQINTISKIENDAVQYSISYSVTEKSADQAKTIENSQTVEIPSGIKNLYESSVQVVDNYGEEICLSCITNIAQKNNVKVDITKPENITYFTITDDYSKVNDVPIKWIFAYEN